MTNRAHEYGDRLIAAWVTRYRNLLCAQAINKAGDVDSSLEQDLGCLTLTKADVSMCSKYCFNENTYYVELPALLEVNDNISLTFFGLIDKQTRIPVSNFSYGNYTKYNRFSPKRVYGELIGSTVFLHNVDDYFPIEAVNARGVWASPENLVTNASPTTPLLCYDWDKDQYPMMTSLDSVMMDMIYSKELQIAIRAITDKTDDDVTTEAL